MVKAKKALIYILLLAFLVRIFPLSFPPLTAEEARVAFRSYVLITEGKDELGRDLPFLFNSSTDYQLPLTSYVTAIGIKLFGKNELGARILFVVLGTLIVYFVYLNSKKFLALERFNLLAAILTALNPSLIFLSKVPNESIILILLFSILFQLLVTEKTNIFFIGIVILLLIATSKTAWFILFPFICLSIFVHKKSITKNELFPVVFSLIFLTVSVYIFFLIPQAKRSFMENNFTLFTDQSVLTSINRLRGQGIESGWPGIMEKILFNKFQTIIIGMLNYLGHYSPGIWFGWFDIKGIYSFVLTGLVSKVLVIPFLFGLYLLIKRDLKKLLILFLYFVFFSVPAVFQYPNISHSYLILTVIVFIFISTFGLFSLSNRFQNIFVVLVLIEILFIYAFIDFQITNLNEVRPSWIFHVIKDVSQRNESLALSDNITSDFASYYKWHTEFKPSDDFKEIIFPYKIGAGLKNLYIIGSKTRIGECELGYVENVYLSEKEHKKIKENTKKTPDIVFKNNRGKDSVFYYKNLCLQEII